MFLSPANGHRSHIGHLGSACSGLLQLVGLPNLNLAGESKQHAICGMTVRDPLNMMLSLNFSLNFRLRTPPRSFVKDDGNRKNRLKNLPKLSALQTL